jgi:hypothetical protein
VKLLLEKGVILAQSRLADTEKRIIRVQDRARRRVHLDDGLWHSVCLIRELSSVSDQPAFSSRGSSTSSISYQMQITYIILFYDNLMMLVK